MNCTGSYKGRYIIGPFKQAKVLKSNEADLLWEVKEYEKPIKVGEHIEFALGTCEESSDALFKEAFMAPRK